MSIFLCSYLVTFIKVLSEFFFIFKFLTKYVNLNNFYLEAFKSESGSVLADGSDDVSTVNNNFKTQH